MRNLKYAILGLLNQKDMTGYDLMKEFESTLCEFWYATHSQLYPELKKLSDEGCINFTVEVVGTTLEKKVYTITDQGREEFLDWLSAETDAQPTPKDVRRLKVFFSAALDDEQRDILFNEQLMQHKRRLSHLKRNMQKFDTVPDKSSDSFGDYLVLVGAIMREEMNIEWLGKCIELSK